jgi:hypothetical protein
MKKVLTAFLILFFFCFHSLQAQFIRKVVVEEATNASCGPCASQNPSFQKWINNHLDRVIPVIYHAWWPGSTDPMYLYNTNMNQTRINYYGISGVPSGRVNGKIAPPTGTWYEGAVGDTVALNTQLAAEPFYSTISVEITNFSYNQSDGKGTVKISVTSMNPISNVYLRIVICEEHHHYDNAGTNGEKEFYWVARTMLPTPTGTLLDLNENETKTFEFPFSVDISFTDDLYAVAFVQNDDTKEILQGSWTKTYPYKEPDYALFIFSNNLVGVGGNGDNFEMDGMIINNTSNAATFNVSLLGTEKLPSDWSASIENNLSQVTVEPNSKKQIKAYLTVGQTPFVSDIKFKIQQEGGNYSEQGSSLTIYHSGISRLHILGGATKHSIQPIIDETLGYGYMFDISEKNFTSLASKFSSLKTIVWDGSTAGDFTANSANIIYDALNKKQNILICGGRISSGMVSNGVLSNFGIGFIAYCREGYGQAPYPVKLAGVPGDPITGDFGNNIQGYLISYLLPLYRIINSSTTTPIMTFAKSADSICAVKVQLSGSRAIILGMNPYIIYDETIRKNLISRSLLWLEDKLSDVEISNSNENDMLLYPNPATTISYLTFTINKTVNQCKVELLDIQGKVIRTIFDTQIPNPGCISIPVNLIGIPSQPLYLRVNLDGKINYLPLIKN